LLLVVAVVVPTACVLWFMRAAVQNERLAVRQKLEDAYRPQLTSAASELGAHWEQTASALPTVLARGHPARVFADLVEGGACDSAVVYDGRGRPAYPSQSPDVSVEGMGTEPEGWVDARQLEHERSDFVAAAVEYGTIAERTSETQIAARALQAQARCLVKAGQEEAALDILLGRLADTRYGAETDSHARFIVPNARLLALKLMEGRSHPRYPGTLESLATRLADYGEPVLPSPQRRFLMRQLQALSAGPLDFPTLAAEELAGEYLETESALPEPSCLLPTKLNGVWQLASEDRTSIALFRERSLLVEMHALAQSQVSLPGVELELLPPGPVESKAELFLIVPAGEHMPGWRLALLLEGPDPFAAAADKQIAAYLSLDWRAGNRCDRHGCPAGGPIPPQTGEACAS